MARLNLLDELDLTPATKAAATTPSVSAPQPVTTPATTGVKTTDTSAMNPAPTAALDAVTPVPATPTPTTTPAAKTTAATAAPNATIDISQLPYLGSLEGFEHTKLADSAHATVKYKVGRLMAKYPPTAAGLAALVADPEFKGLGIQSLGNGNLKLPDGTVIDAIRGFQQGGQGWQWGVVDPNAAATPTPTGTGNYTWNGSNWVDNATGYIWNGSAWVPVPGGAGSVVPGMGTTAVGDYGIPGTGTYTTSDEFTDPTTANLEALLNFRVNELNTTVNDPARQQYADLLQQYITSLSETDPALTNLVGSLESQAQNYLTPSAFESIGNEEISRLATLDPTYRAAADQRLSQLQSDPYTGAEWEMYRTGVLDPIEQDRKAAQDRAMAEMSQRGIDPSSGIGQQMLLEVNRQFDQSRAVEQGNLGRARVEQRQANQAEAFNVQTALEALLNSRRSQRTDLAQTLADWTANRGERATQLYGTLAEIPTARAQQQLQGAQTLESLSQSVRGEEQSRRSEALALQGLLAELPERRLQLALATLGQGSTPESMMGSLTSLASLSNQRAATQAAQSQANWTGMGSLAQILASLYQGTNQD